MSRYHVCVVTDSCHAAPAFQSKFACHAMLGVETGGFSAMEYKSFHDMFVKRLIDLVKMHLVLYHLGHMVWNKSQALAVRASKSR